MAEGSLFARDHVLVLCDESGSIVILNRATEEEIN
jgi:hypothetical protein